MTQIWPCWTPWGSHGLTPQASQDHSGWNSFPWLYLLIWKLSVSKIPLCISLEKALNSTGPSMDSAGTPPLMGWCHLDIEPLTVTFWMWPPSQFLTCLTDYPSKNPMSLHIRGKNAVGKQIKCFTDIIRASFVHWGNYSARELRSL